MEPRVEGSETGSVWVPLQRMWYSIGNVCHGNTHWTYLKLGYWGNRLHASHQLSSERDKAFVPSLPWVVILPGQVAEEAI